MPTTDPTASLNPHFTGLECSKCSKQHAHDSLQTLCTDCGMPLLARYNLPALSPKDLAGRVTSLWRYREALPLRANEVTLGEGFTPVLQVSDHVWVKDEAQNPTGSFKARGMSAAVSMAKVLGATGLCAPSAGNAASALAAYGAAANMPVLVSMPEDTPRAFVDECRHYGAEVKLIAGTISDAGVWLKKNAPVGAFDVSTLKEPYRVEGKKTMGYELFEQFDQALPDVILYPTGGGTGLIGMWKAFDEMQTLGWIDDRRPRMVSVQAAGCAPVVRALDSGDEQTTAWADARTEAYGLRVPAPIGGFLCVRAIKESRGTGVAVAEADIAPAAQRLSQKSGIDICPEAGAAWAATEQLLAKGWIKPTDKVVVFNTGTGLKYR